MPSTTKMAKPRSQSTTKHIIIINKTNGQSQSQKPDHQKQAQTQYSWAVVRGILTCKYQQDHQNQNQNQNQLVQSPKKQNQKQLIEQNQTPNKKMSKKMRCSGSLCSNTKVMQRPHDQTTASPELHKKRASSTSSNNINSSDQSSSSNSNNGVVSTSTSYSTSSSSLSLASTSSMSSSTVGSSFRGMPFRRFSGCYECRSMVVDPLLGIARDPSLRGTICSCPDCGEIFMKPENLELHQAVKHAVSELGAEDTSKNIVEIIFQSSWLKKQNPQICPKIDRILKVHNTQTTLSNFESYRESVKAKARAAKPSRHSSGSAAAGPRCVADGNELLRFHAATFACSLGLNGSNTLCSAASAAAAPPCRVCAIIRHGFRCAADRRAAGAILTTATSGRAHGGAAAAAAEGGENKRAMLVCRVIAGRVRKSGGGGAAAESGAGAAAAAEEYDSVAGAVGVYSNLDELYVFNPKAILPCFVVIYSGV